MGLSAAESEYISNTKGAAHALHVRSAMVEYGMTFKAVCETDASARRAMAMRRGAGRARLLDARLLCLQQLCAEGVVRVRARPGEHNEADLGTKMVRFEANDIAFERNTPSATKGLELMDGGDETHRACTANNRLQCLDLNVRNMCETSGWFWICVGKVVIAIVTVLPGRLSANPISDDCSRQKGTDKNGAWRRPLRNDVEHR